MRTVVRAILLLLLAAHGSARAEAPKGAAGLWLGTLPAGAIKLRLAFHIDARAGGFTATCDSLDQGARGMPVDKVAVDGGKVRLELTAIGATFEGTLGQGGDTLTGTFTQHGVAMPLALARVDSIAPPRRPQEPKPPFPYDAVEVGYENGAGHVHLAGTLTRPRDSARHGAVLLITGSGPQNRDEEVFGHKPFWVIADALTRRGIVVLRVDDRGVGGSTGDPRKSTTDDFAGDALAGVEFLKTRPEVDPKHIGLVGHSEGGLIAPMVAARSRDVAFVVLLAGTGVPGDEILLFQNGVDADRVKANPALAEKRKLTEELFAILKQDKPDAAAQARAAMMKMAEVKALPADQVKGFVDAQVQTMSSPWFRRFLAIDPRDSLKKVTCPVLALNGERDQQVSAKQNLPEIAAALKAARNSDFTVEALPELNHLFQHCATGQPTEYAALEETFAPSALQKIGDWIVKHAK
ncbi:MAG TPA: alpha/beta fold hydrolase [Polyangia bacterium]|nr:alpha/beta fold hydrolase [Polyangia bacterium]